MVSLTKRQQNILEYIRQNPEATNAQITKYISTTGDAISRHTVIRDLDTLIKLSVIKKIGKGRSIRYSDTQKTPLLRFFDPNTYFKTVPDKRIDIQKRFDFDIFSYFEMTSLFTENELQELNKLTQAHQKSLAELSPGMVKKEFERLTIELSWKSSQIEGNTYSLLDTEVLIKEHKEASGHTKEEAIMLLNHKSAFDFILKNKSRFKKMRVEHVEAIHAYICADLNIAKNIRSKSVGVVGTTYRPLDNAYQIKESLEKMCLLINYLKTPYEKALAGIVLTSYIQPFEDGNKRTSRMVGNALLLAGEVSPLSYRSIDEVEYKKAILLFYEQNSLLYFQKLFVEQYKFAVENYFR